MVYLSARCFNVVLNGSMTGGSNLGLLYSISFLFLPPNMHKVS